MKALAVSNENGAIIEQLNFILQNGNRDHQKRLGDMLDLIIENMKSDRAPSGTAQRTWPERTEPLDGHGVNSGGASGCN